MVKYFPDEFLPPLDILPFFFKAYLRDFVAANPDFFLLQVGAHDGDATDPIRDAILAHHLRGLLIEPLPDVFSRLKENYKSETQLLFENVAIGDEPGRLPFYRIKPEATLEWGQTLAGFDRGHLISRGLPEEAIEEIYVEVVTIPSLLDKHGIKVVNMLQVDTEGFDYRIVKAVLNAGLRPEIINYEHCDISRAEQVECKRMLYDIGYRFTDVGIDTLCRLHEDAPALASVGSNGPAG